MILIYAPQTKPQVHQTGSAEFQPLGLTSSPHLTHLAGFKLYDLNLSKMENVSSLQFGQEYIA